MCTKQNKLIYLCFGVVTQLLALPEDARGQCLGAGSCSTAKPYSEKKGEDGRGWLCVGIWQPGTKNSSHCFTLRTVL